ncbi:MAG: ASCH domain-containing protein, partial [Chroococcidiopsis sp.]
MKALSIRQPWAWLIVNGYKDIENRNWRCYYRGLLLIHASKTFRKYDYREAMDFIYLIDKSLHYKIPAFEDFEKGGIVGGAYLNNCVSKSESPWFVG